MSTWTGRLLWEAPGPGAVGKTGSWKVAAPQGNPAVPGSALRRPCFFGGQDANDLDDLFLKQSAVIKGSCTCTHSFIHSFIPSLPRLAAGRALPR